MTLCLGFNIRRWLKNTLSLKSIIWWWPSAFLVLWKASIFWFFPSQLFSDDSTKVVRPLSLLSDTIARVEVAAFRTMANTFVREKVMKTIHVFVPSPWANISATQKATTLRKWGALLCKDKCARWRLTATTTAEICLGGTMTSFIVVKTFTATLQIHLNKERVVLLSRFLGLSLIKQLISSELWHRNVFTVGRRLRMWLVFPRGCSPRLCWLTGPLLYKQLRMLNCEKL